MLEWECPNCRESNYVDSDWDTCLQMCEVCGSESAVKLSIEGVELKIKRDKDKEDEGDK